MYYKEWQEDFTYSFSAYLKNFCIESDNQKRFTNFKIIMAKCDKKLLQGVTGITKWDNLSQSVTSIVKSDKMLLQSVTGIAKYGNYYEVRKLLLDAAGGLILSSEKLLDFHAEIWLLLVTFLKYS